jgi:hypothetical protein
MGRTAIKRATALICLAFISILGLGPSSLASASEFPGTLQVGAVPTCGWGFVKAPEVNGSLSAVATISDQQAWAVGFQLNPDFVPLVSTPR